MTRESKLALVLGFSLMLFVLILVSDHMAARNAPVIATNIEERSDLGVPPLPGPGTGGALVLQTDEGSRLLPQEAPAISDPAQRGEDPESGVRIADGGPAPNNTPGLKPDGGSQPKLPETPSVRTYTIKSGDTLAAIASREYKKRSLGAKLAEYNGIDPSRMKVGTVVKLPPINELDPSAAPQLASKTSTPGSNETPERPSLPTFRMYKVKQGDTLYGIAERELGGPSRLRELRSANSEVLKGSDSLHPGMQIRIPERGGTLTSASTDA
jgi:nucleoid-associated protein YgaU